MRTHHHHSEHHSLERKGWLRAAVLGANDGILSTASLILGVATATDSQNGIMVAGLSGLVAGAMSMAAGEYVSVSSQADTEKANIELERRELAEDEAGELNELTQIYVKRGLDQQLAGEVAKQLTARDALEAHARDELGITEATTARPLQAAFASAASFSGGAAIPVLAGLLSPLDNAVAVVYGTSLAFLAVLGALGAKTGNAPILRGAVRVTFWGAFAMAITAGIGALFHVQL